MKKVFFFVLLILLICCLPVAAKTDSPRMEANYSFSTDSDLVTTRAWRIGTIEEEKPWNFTFYRTKISQPYQFLYDNTLVAKYHTLLQNAGGLTFWTGVTQNRIRNFYPYAVMYDGKIGKKGNVWLSYGNESVGTITAYEQNIHHDNAGVSLQYRFHPGVDGNIEYNHMRYSDSNNRDKLTMAVSKKLDNMLTIKGGYVYDGADHKADGLYYVPVNEHAYFLEMNWTIPMGETSLALNASQSFQAYNSDGSIVRHGIGTEFKWKQFLVGMRYDRSGDYWSHSWNANWQIKW